MTYEYGHGSLYSFQDLTLAQSASQTIEICDAGKRCVMDTVLIGYSITGTNSGAVDHSIQDQAGNELHLITADHDNVADSRDAYKLGPHGIRSTNGLQVVVTNQDPGTRIKVTYLYRELA